MKSRSKSNNFVAIFIALLLFTIGFVLYFIHQQSESGGSQDNTQTGTTYITPALTAASNTWPATTSLISSKEVPHIPV
jgi:hypothetical protein